MDTKQDANKFCRNLKMPQTLVIAGNLKVVWQRIRDRINFDAVLCN